MKRNKDIQEIIDSVMGMEDSSDINWFEHKFAKKIRAFQKKTARKAFIIGHDKFVKYSTEKECALDFEKEFGFRV